MAAFTKKDLVLVLVLVNDENPVLAFTKHRPQCLYTVLTQNNSDFVCHIHMFLGFWHLTTRG